MRTNCFFGTIAVFIIALNHFAPISYAAQRDIYPDSWTATDALGRTLCGYKECGPPRADKYVGIFYWTWHRVHGAQGPYDNTKIIAADPNNPHWGPIHAPHHWGEPELGYYISTDPFVIRKHASMLTNAGVDVIFFDTTNPPYTWKESYMALCKEYSQIRAQGNKTPQIAFLAPFGDPTVVVETVFNDLYSKNLYPELWFIWQGKPLIMADPAPLKNPKIKQFFTFRKPIPSYFTGPSGPDQWGWLEVYPQHVFHNSKGQAEQMTVGIAQNAVGNQLSAMSHHDGAMGRSWHSGHKDSRPDAVNYGYNFVEQWNRALEVDPTFIFITGWNEWVAGRFKKWHIYTGSDSYFPDALFVDQYNHEYSRDIEPMKDGHTDNYYYQMIDYIRRFKGVRKPQITTASVTIVIDGIFSDWASVQPEFRDSIGDTAHRDHKGYGKTHYINNTGRNDLVTLKVACDSDNIYFYAQTREDLTGYKDPNWMLLFIDSDLNNKTGFQGYDYLINSPVLNATRTTLKQNTTGWNWKTTAELTYAVSANELELKIPRISILPPDQKKIAFNFHWADNLQHVDDIVEFSVSGDNAPDRRFNYHYENELGSPHKN
ncbi:MAG: hypothetical protein JXD22_00930 [Sedimentisphaerales bacterium]|nr:hypothetical protein [Sedimentisphaerales bacterium]